MKTFNIFKYFALIALFGASTACSSDEPTKVEPLPEFPMTPAEHEIAKAQSNFQIEMFADIVKEELSESSSTANLNFSPVNATIALSVLANAADDENARKISSLIGYDDLAALNAYNLRLNEYLPQQPEGNTLELANGTWYAKGLTLNPSFVETLASVYSSMPAPVDFALQETVDLINNWASEKTHGLIKSIVYRNSLPINTQMFLASALYYNGLWSMPFSESETQDRVFHGINGDLDVPTMYRKGRYAYNRIDDGAEILKMPFKNHRVSLYVVLPPRESDVVEYASSFTSEKFNTLTEDMDFYDVKVYIPKYEYRDQISLDSYLLQKNLNIGNIDMAGAGISGITPIATCQDTYFRIDEKGVELAAITSIDTGMVGPSQSNEFRVDRPFIFFVREEKTGSILMAGVMRDIPLDK